MLTTQNGIMPGQVTLINNEGAADNNLPAKTHANDNDNLTANQIFVDSFAPCDYRLKDLGRARSALNYLDPGCDRETWHKIGRSAIAAGLTIDDLDTWSATAGNYAGTRDVRAAFRGITAEGGTTAATLFAMARDAGWVDGDKPQSNTAAKATTRPPEPSRKPGPGTSVSEMFERCEAATNEHGYISAKQAAGVPLDSLRVVPTDDNLVIAGQSMAGYLVVPAHAPDGELQSLQFIPPNGGKKLNLPGAGMAGASFTVGRLVPGCIAYIVEGIGQAWACWQATEEAAVVCFGAGNMRKVATELRQQDPGVRLVLVPDVGKEANAQKIAAEVGAAVATIPEGEANNFDANDLLLRDGFDVLAARLEAATEPPKPPPWLRNVSVFDVITNPSPPPGFVWDGYLPRGHVALLGAHGGTGKSTIALMLAVCAVLGRPLFGVNTEACEVLFLSLEDGPNLVRHRLASICKAWLIDPEQLRDKLHIVDGTEHPELFTAETRGAGELTSSYFELRKLVQSGNIGLVVVDNASDAFGGDEIQRRQVRAFIRSLAEIARLNNSAVMLLAHVDKTTSRNRSAAGGEAYSGSTAWHNSARSRLFLTRGDDGLLTLEHQKNNLGCKREPIKLNWLTGGFPQLVEAGGFDANGFMATQQGRADDDRAAELLRLIAEFESRGQYCSPVATARNNVYAMLRSEPDFQKLKLNSDSTKRILNQCQRAKWIEPMDYRTHDRKTRQKWVLTTEGYGFAGLGALCAPSAPSWHESAESAGGAPCAPSCVGGVGESARTEQGATGSGDE